jgi:large subunit ribosomal protein L25
MKSVVIKGQKRETVGKKNARMLRINGKVPCVLYGGDKPLHFYAEFGEFRKVIYTPEVFLIDLEIEGETYKTILQDQQWHPVEEKLLHVDFLLIKEDKPVKMEIPVKTEGLAKGIKQGGKLYVNLRKMRVKALAKDLPDSIDIQVEDLDIGDSIKVGDLKRDNLEFLNDPSNVVVGVIVTRMAKSLLPEEIEKEELEGEETGEESESEQTAKTTE